MSEIQGIEALDLAKIRTKIDEIDAALVALWAERNALAMQVGTYKRAHGLPVLQLARDGEVRRGFEERCETLGISRVMGRRVISAIMMTSYSAQGVPVGMADPEASLRRAVDQ